MKTKKILKTVLILCLPIMLLAATDNEVKWKAVKGRKSKDCDGRGICIVKEQSVMATDFTFAISDGGDLSIRINKSELENNQPDAYEELMYSDVYEIDEEVIFPAELCQALEVEEEYTIPSGSYPMIDKGEEFVIDITQEGMTSK